MIDLLIYNFSATVQGVITYLLGQASLPLDFYVSRGSLRQFSQQYISASTSSKEEKDMISALVSLYEKENLIVSDFKLYMNNKDKEMNLIFGLLNLLTIQNSDTDTKEIFSYIKSSIVFPMPYSDIEDFLLQYCVRLLFLLVYLKYKYILVKDYSACAFQVYDELQPLTQKVRMIKTNYGALYTLIYSGLISFIDSINRDTLGDLL